LLCCAYGLFPFATIIGQVMNTRQK